MANLRRVEITYGANYYEAWFHGFFQTEEGPIAILEIDDGSIRYEKAFYIRFLTPNSKENIVVYKVEYSEKD